MSKPLTKIQKEVLDVLTDTYTRKGYMPTVREICGETGRAPSTIQQHLNMLQAKGYIRLDRTPRGVSLINISESRNVQPHLYITHRIVNGQLDLLPEAMRTRIDLPIAIADDRVVLCRASQSKGINRTIQKDDILLVRIHENENKNHIENFTILAVIRQL